MPSFFSFISKNNDVRLPKNLHQLLEFSGGISSLDSKHGTKCKINENRQKIEFFNVDTVFPRFSTPGRLPIFEVFGGALNRAGALTRALTFIKTYENLDLPFPAYTRTLFIIYDNKRNSNILKELLN